jgi:O-antigen/teichoic acid export membrane protein
MAGRQSLARAGAFTVLVTTTSLSLNLVTGILVARILGPHGRGALTAALAAPPILSWIFEMGCAAAATYYQARHPEDAPRLISTWLVLFIPLTIAGVIIGEAALPHLLAAQSSHTLFLARLLMPTIAFVFVADLMYGLILGDQDYRFYNGMRLAQPLGVCIGYVTLWAVGALTVDSAVATTAVTSALVTLILLARVLGRHGIGRPSLAIGRETLWYGVRAHSTFTAGLVNTRLDVLIIPAFLSASSVGLYGVATNVSWIVVTVSGGLAAIVLPAAAARGADGRYTVVKSLYATLGVAGAVAIVLGVFAEVGVRVLYGPAFLGSVEPLRILLVGAVLYAGAATVCSGLYSLNRPFTAAIAQLSGAAVTVVGLTLFLRTGGINVAAVVSTVAYALVFVVALHLYRRASGLAWRELLIGPSMLRLWIRQAVQGAAGGA